MSVQHSHDHQVGCLLQRWMNAATRDMQLEIECRVRSAKVKSLAEIEFLGIIDLLRQDLDLLP